MNIPARKRAKTITTNESTAAALVLDTEKPANVINNGFLTSAVLPVLKKWQRADGIQCHSLTSFESAYTKCNLQ
ncbi:MAG: hypothetical protein ACSLEM_04675 [Candidatus Malihini olakiniferum]